MMKNFLLASVAGIALMLTAGTSSAQAGGVYVGPGVISVGGRSFQLNIGSYGGYGYGYGYRPYGGYYNYPQYPQYPQYPSYPRYPQYRPPVVPNHYHPSYPHYHYHRGW